MVKKPSGISFAKLKRDPVGFSDSLNRNQAVSTARYLDFMYHDKNKQIVPDEVYDIIKDSIADRWPKSKYLREIGYKPTKSGRTETVKLPVNMPSMDKRKPGTPQLLNFITGTDVMVISDKLDGISLLLEYDNGILSRCFTRGDGTEGQDVSGVIPALKAPKKISVRGIFRVRCEFIIKRKSFNKTYSKGSGGDYATGRNMGGGLLTHNKPTGQVRSFECVAYEISSGPNAGKKTSVQFAYLKRLGFNVVRHKIVKNTTPEDMFKYHDQFKKTAHYEIDGIIMARDVAYKITANNPKHAKAFKINSIASSMIVPVKEVEYRRSRLNRMIPRIIIDPIQLGGVTVTYFTGHSYYYIQHGFTYSDYKKAQKEKKRLRTLPINVGAKIRVIRSGDVIPYIMGVERPSRKAAQPSVDFKLGPNGVHAIAVEDISDADKKKKITHFFSSLKIEGLKAGTVSKLYDAGFDDVGSILFAEADELLEIEGIQEKTANNIVKNIDIGLAKAKFSTIGYASGTFDEAIGSRKLQFVIDMYPDYIEHAKKKTVRQLEAMIALVPGIKTQSMAIAEGSKQFIKWLDDVGLNLEPEEVAVQKSNKLGGLKVLFTSVRDTQLLEDIEANGGKKASSVKAADVLVIKPNASNNKTMQAEEQGKPIYTVAQFRTKYGI